MSLSAWRTALFVACAIATIAATAELFCVTGLGAPAWLGIRGTTEATSGRPFVERIATARRNGAAWQAGVRGGDTVDIRGLKPIDRFGMIGQPLASRPVHLPLQRGAEQVNVTLVPTPDLGWRGFPPDYLEALAAIWLSLFAWLLAIRKSADPEVRVLVLTLACSTLWIVTDIRDFAVPWTLGYVLITVVFALAGPVAIALWAAFAGFFGRPISRLRIALKWACYALGILAALASLAYPLGVLTLWVDPVQSALSPIWLIPHLLQVLAALTCGIVAIASVKGELRQRAAWPIVGIALIFCIQPFTQYGQDVSTSYNMFLVFLALQGVAILLAPLGLTYAVLSRRLLSVEFVLSKAAAFSGVSIVLVATFVLVESLLNDWLRDASHATNVVATAGLALGLGFSIRAVHLRVERIVDTVFFRKRHEDEEAIRTFAHDAPYITDRKILFERAVQTLEQHADALFARILVADETGSYDGIGENDPAVLRLRARRATVDLHGIDTAIAGDLAFPMVLRGRVVGIVVLGPRRSGEAYAPDERAAIEALAQSVALGLDTNAHTEGFVGLRQALSGIQSSIDRLVEASQNRSS